MKRLIPFLLLGLVIGLPAVLAQGVTTSALNGKVEGKTVDKVVDLPGALIEAVHVPTGTNYQVITRDDGGYTIPNMKTGGPYTVTFTNEGFKKEEVKDVYLKLGEVKTLNVQLVMESINAGEVVVVASNPIINNDRTGASQNVELQTIEDMPSINRSLSDLARLSPQFDNNKERPGSFNANGRSARYNNIQIDGSQNNDLFGLGELGTPGGQTESTPISMDAVQEFQIVLAPYDVRQGGFTGGGVNVVTRSGTNEFHGSMYFYGRNSDLIGKGTSDTKYPSLREFQTGFAIGGPIVKDRFFFFVNGEISRRRDPSEYVIDGSGSVYDLTSYGRVTVADAQRFVDICKNTYNYDPGSYNTFITRRKDANKLFLRFDFTINSKHNLTVRNNYNSPVFDRFNQTPGSSYTAFKTPDVLYWYDDTTNSTVGQLSSTFTNSVFNEAIVSYTTIRDRRAGPTYFPTIQVYVKGNSGFNFTAGREYSSTANELDQDVMEITDNLTWIKGKHSFVFGTHNEIYKFRNLFIQNSFGSYRFASLEDFAIGKANRYQYGYSNDPNDPNKSVSFRVAQLGFYAGDTWSILPNFKLTYGLRVDVPYILDTPTANPDTVTYFGIRTDQVPSGNLLWSPRAGFNWDVMSDGKNNLRGGVGIFTGRVPYVWLSNQFSYTGIEFTRIDVTSNVPTFSPDPDNQPKNFAGAKNEINLIDDEFKYPSILRFDMGFDRQLPWGLVATVEYVYTKVLKDILYQNINLKATGNSWPDGRPLYGTPSATGNTWTTNWMVSKYTNCLYLTNTDEGNSWNMSFQLQKQFSKGFSANASYTYGKSYDVNSGSSSVAFSNWRYNPIGMDPNNPEKAFSNFDVRHNLKVAVTYQHAFLKDAPTTISMFYNSRSGRPFSYIYYNDANGDGTNNDLIYVPRDSTDIILTSNNWALLDAFISGDPALNNHRGEIVKRNSARDPWNHNVDLRILQDIPMPWLKGHKLEFSMDIMNFLNLLNKNWGQYWYSNFDNSPLTYQGKDAATGKPKFSYYDGPRYTKDELLSRWQIQFGLRYAF